MKTKPYLKKLLFVIVMAPIALVGCSKNDPAKPSIVGKWYIKADTGFEYTKGILDAKGPINQGDTSYYQFNADGTGMTIKALSDGYNFNNIYFHYTIQNNLIYEVNEIDPDLPLPVGANNHNTAMILELTSNNLVILFNVNSPDFQEKAYLSR